MHIHVSKIKQCMYFVQVQHVLYCVEFYTGQCHIHIYVNLAIV